MSHMLDMTSGSASIAFVGETPWHGLGVQVDENISPREMMKAAGVDWRVMEMPSFVEFNGEKRMTGLKALVRETDGRVLTQVGKNWEPCQNEEAFDFFHDFTSAGNMKMHTAGALKDGEVVWVLAKIDDSFELFGGDKVDGHMLFTNPHQYGKTIDIRFTPIRVVCNNTLTLALSPNSGAKGSVQLNHRRKFDPDMVKEMMGLAHSKLEQYKEIAEYLGSKRYTTESVKNYFGEVFGRSKKDENELSRTGKEALVYLDTQPGAEFAEGSWWQAMNAVTYMTDHILGRSNDTRLQSAWYGANRNLKNDAVKTALDFAEAA